MRYQPVAQSYACAYVMHKYVCRQVLHAVADGNHKFIGVALSFQSTDYAIYSLSILKPSVTINGFASY